MNKNVLYWATNNAEFKLKLELYGVINQLTLVEDKNSVKSYERRSELNNQPRPSQPGNKFLLRYFMFEA